MVVYKLYKRVLTLLVCVYLGSSNMFMVFALEKSQYLIEN